MGQWWRYRVVAGALAAALTLEGCATASGGREGTAVVAGVPQESQCSKSVNTADGPGPWLRTGSYSALGINLGAAWGAADGASWGFIYGANSGQAAWIGAAAGAGVGLVIGLVAGAVKGREAQASYPTAQPACAADGPPAADKTILAETEPDG